MFKYYFFGLITVLFSSAHAQPDLNFIRYTTEHGLANNDVLCICQDNFGFLWIGTKSGCSRFDGIQFKNYTYIKNKPGSIGQGWVNKIVCDTKGRLWFALAGTGSSFMLYDYEKDVFIDKSNIIREMSDIDVARLDFWYIYLDSTGLFWFHAIDFTLGSYCPETNEVKKYYVNGGVSSILEDENHNLWLASGGQGLVFFNRKSGIFTSYKYDPSEPGSLSSNKCYTVFRDSEKNIWVGTKEGLNRMISEPNDSTFRSGTPIKFEHFQFLPNNRYSLSSNLVYDIIEDQNKNLFIATVDGLCVMDKKSKRIFRYYTDETDNESINSNLIRVLFRDKHNNIWAGTNLGVGKLQIKKFRSYSHSSYKNSISHNKVQHLFQAPDSSLWVSTPKGIDVFDPRKKSFHFKLKVNNDGKGLNSPPLVLQPNGKKGVFIGTWGGGLHYFNYAINKTTNFTRDHDLPGTYSIFSMGLDVKNQLWIGTANSGLSVFNMGTGKYKAITYEQDKKNSLSSNRILSILEDKDATIWIGTNNGLNKLIDFTNGLFNHYLDGLTINSIYESSRKHLWFGTNEGLYQFNKQDQSFTKYDMQNGFPGNEILGILEDDSQNLWVSTNKGLLRVTLSSDSTCKVVVFRKEEGITVDNFSPRSCAKLSNGSMVFGGSKGFCLFHPEQIEKDTISPTVVFTNLKIANKAVKVGEYINNQVVLPKSISTCKQLALNHKNNEFAIEFTGLQYNMPKYNHYAYRLEGYDAPNSPWHKRTNAYPLVEYMNLPSGEYIFKVKAANSYGIWSNKPAELKIIILPPWWKTIWFTGLWIIVVISVIVLYTRYRTYKLNRQKRLLEKTVAERTIQLQEMNLILEERQEELETQARQMADMNNELKQINQDLKYKTSEVEEMAKRIHASDQRQLRFFANISHEFRTPLTLIIGTLEKYANIKTLKSTNEWGKINNYLQIAHRNAKRLTRLVNQILDFRKIDQKALTLKISCNNISDFINDVVNAFAPMAEAKGIQLKVKNEEFRVKSEEPTKRKGPITDHSSLLTQFWFDPDVMEKILYNLISNAMKYTPEGGRINIHLRVKNEGLIIENKNKQNENPSLITHHTSLIIKIIDTGIGIKPEELDKIFDRFYRVETRLTEPLPENQSKGTGIGLAYTLELVKLHNGEITVASKTNKGTTFTLNFPIEKNPLQHRSKDVSSYNSKLSYIPSMIESTNNVHLDTKINENILDVQKKDTGKDTPLILLVEDNIDLRTFVKTELQLDYKILEATNGKEGLEVIHSEIPDLIISDIMMPVMDGIEFCKKVRANESTSHVPIIMLTAKVGEENILEGLKTGAGDYIVKPFNLEVLKLKIKNLFDLRKSLQDKFATSVSAQPEDVTYSFIDEKFLEKAIKIVNNNLDNYTFDNDSFITLMDYSRALVYKKIKALTGQSVSEFIRNIRLKAGAQMFLDGNDNIAQVSYQVGFKHASDFSRYFRKLFNKSPKQFIQDGK